MRTLQRQQMSSLWRVARMLHRSLVGSWSTVCTVPVHVRAVLQPLCAFDSSRDGRVRVRVCARACYGPVRSAAAREDGACSGAS